MNINEAAKLLIDGYVLSSFAENTRFIFLYENRQICVYSDKYNSKISLDLFKNIYKNFVFDAIETDEKFAEDRLKDIEYYQKLQKHQ